MNVRRTRLVTGLILLTYLSTHLLNHALGLISLDAMNDGRVWFLALWRNPAGTALLYTSLLTHFSLALWSLYQRRHLRIPLWEALQLTLGLSIPPLLSLHFVGTRMQHEWFGVDDSYSLLVLTLWHAQPWDGLKQATLITVAWLHGCIGFHFWLRLRPWYRRVAPIFLGCALLLPVLGLLGFTQAGHEVDSLVARNPDWIAQVVQQSNVPPRSQRESLYRLDDAIVATYVLAVILTLLARIARDIFERRSRIRIRYPGGARSAGAARFFSPRSEPLCRYPACVGLRRPRPLLDLPDSCHRRTFATAAAERMPSKECCSASARRRTCAWLANCGRWKIFPVTPLVPANAHASDGYAQPSYLAGQERTIAVLFADLRTFTGIAEQKLPYDLVFLLNSYFETVGESIASAGGMVDKFIGDGVMALFGIEAGPAEGCRQALAAAKRMVDQVQDAQPGARRGVGGTAQDRRRHTLRTGGGRPHGLWRHHSFDGHRRHGQRGEPPAGSDKGIQLPVGDLRRSGAAGGIERERDCRGTRSR